MPNNFADARLKLTLEEETSLANPYGVLTLDYNYLRWEEPLFHNATYESSVLDSNQVQFQATVFLDNGILTGTALGQTLLFYGTKILHNQNSGGYGTVTELIFAPNAVNAYANAVPQFSQQVMQKIIQTETQLISQLLICLQ